MNNPRPKIAPRMWENRVIRLPDNPELEEAELDELALEGWKLVSVWDHKAYLIRRAPVTILRSTQLARAD